MQKLISRKPSSCLGQDVRPQDASTVRTSLPFKAFTLIELLVVIAIIAAILFPVFARARENARRSSCQSNLKQIALGFVQYTQDYDEKYPGWIQGAGTKPADHPDARGWAEVLQPYMKSTQIFQCPSETNAPGVDGVGDPSDRMPGYTDYSYNLTLGLASATDPFGQGGISSAKLTQSALTVLAFDYNSGNSFWWSQGCSSGGFVDSNGNANGGGCGAAGLADFSNEGGTGSAFRHLEGQNFAFCDGHVKWFKGSDANHSAKVYNVVTPGSTSGGSPTFNVSP